MADLAGARMAAGLEVRAGPLRLAPGIRITRWDTSSAPAASCLAGTQAEVLLSIGLRRGLPRRASWWNRSLTAAVFIIRPEL
jgi:hypothetical protein